MDEQNIGKKVFFLYPHSVIRDELIKLIIHYEYEVYLLNDHMKAPKLLAKYPDSILFINIDENLSEPEWEAYITQLMAAPETNKIRIGILSYNKDQTLEKKYLIDLMVPCGFVNLKLGLKESATIILKLLEANEVKGRRKYVRVQCDEQNLATLTVKIRESIYRGNIIDLSSAGLACTFENPAFKLDPQELVRDIQLRLKGTICTASGIAFGKRDSSRGAVYVILFKEDLTLQAKSKIQDFIYQTLQSSIDRELARIKLS